LVEQLIDLADVQVVVGDPVMDEVSGGYFSPVGLDAFFEMRVLQGFQPGNRFISFREKIVQ
jgi:hypothetical protein